jgi:5'-deoxynucleotidase YfbR-like HD superfamily hydrolase
MSRTTIETHSGRYFDYSAPAAADICIEDIARSLSMTCRFRGHVTGFYSVAEHSVLVRQLVIEAGRPDLGLAALLHDAHEAYIGDIPTPLKVVLGEELDQIVADIDEAICDAVGGEMWSEKLHHAEVKDADALCLRHEAAVFKQSRGTGEHWGWEHPARRDGFIQGWSAKDAEQNFIGAYMVEVGTLEPPHRG